MKEGTIAAAVWVTRVTIEEMRCFFSLVPIRPWWTELILQNSLRLIPVMFLWYTGGILYFSKLWPVYTSRTHLTGHFHGLGAWLLSIACWIRRQLDARVCVGAVPGTLPGVGSAPSSLPGVRPASCAFSSVRPAPLSFQRGYTGARSCAGPHQPGHTSRGHWKKRLSLTSCCVDLVETPFLLAALTTLGEVFRVENSFHGSFMFRSSSNTPDIQLINPNC